MMSRRSLITKILWIVFSLIAVSLIMLPISHQRDRQVTALNDIAKGMGCTFIEQSYSNPNNYYVDCGNNIVRIIKAE